VAIVDDSEFWAIIERAASPSELHRELGTLSDEDLLEFERRHTSCGDRAYTWDLWGAAYVINGGCSDDTFEYFRAALISRGREDFERALADPDSMVDMDFGDEGEWEDWMSPTMQVVHARTGKYEFVGPRESMPPDEPAGAEWDEDDLPSRFPRLTEKYDF
jgi:hypothetical protein